MTTAVACCHHPVPYQDDDETRCRTCGRSISHPLRTPEEAEAEMKAADDRRVGTGPGGRIPREDYPTASCLRCRIEVYIHPFPSGTVACACDSVLLHVDSRGNHKFPDFTPPRSLRCSCCKEMLPQFSFHRERLKTTREGRASACRGCVAFRNRIKREQRPTEVRERDRIRMEEYRAKVKTEGRDMPRASAAANQAAVQRYRSRKQGRDVLKQRQGKNPILLKPTCRVIRVCPLAPYCVDKVEAGRRALTKT